MNLALFRANGDFSQSSLSIFGNPSGVDSDNAGTARMYEQHLLEQMLRVPQPPKMRKTFGVRRRRKIDLSEKNDRSINFQIAKNFKHHEQYPEARYI